jgi:hypothetical protein
MLQRGPQRPQLLGLCTSTDKGLAPSTSSRTRIGHLTPMAEGAPLPFLVPGSCVWDSVVPRGMLGRARCIKRSVRRLIFHNRSPYRLGSFPSRQKRDSVAPSPELLYVTSRQMALLAEAVMQLSPHPSCAVRPCGRWVMLTLNYICRHCLGMRA